MSILANQLMKKIRILKAANGQFFFRVSAANGAILCSSETYELRSDCINAAKLVNAGGFQIVDET